MSQIQRIANHCDICQHEWLPSSGVVYTHCTSGKCRSRKWNSGEPAGLSPAPAAKQKRMPPAKRLPDGPNGEHRFDRSNQPPLLDSTIKASPLLPKIEAKAKVVIHDGGASLYVQTPAEVMDRLQGLSRHHDRKTCRIYKCGMCAASKG